MRSTNETGLLIPPPVMRPSSATTQAYLDMRSRILLGEFAPDTLITPKEIQEQYHTNNNGTQSLLMHLAIEGLVKLSPVRVRNWRNNAALTEFRIADRDVENRTFTTRQGDVIHDASHVSHDAHNHRDYLHVEYADEEIASLLAIEIADRVIFYRRTKYRDGENVAAITDAYYPFWFAGAMPELRLPDVEGKKDVYTLMRQMGKHPAWCVETQDVVLASSQVRQYFELSLDDPTPFIKILRRTFDETGEPLEVQFQTIRSDMYRLHYSFPLYSTGVPEPFRDK